MDKAFIITARTPSSRLPSKILKKIYKNKRTIDLIIERAEKLKMNFTENYVESPSKMWKDIKPQIELTDEINEELNFITDWLDNGELETFEDLRKLKEKTVILIPLMMMSALKEETRSQYCPSFINSLNLRVMKAISRTDKRLRIDEFCV